LRTNFAPSIASELTPDTSSRSVVLHWLKRPPSGPECWRVSVADCLRQVVAWDDRETAVAALDSARTILQVDDAALRQIFRDESPAHRMVASRSRAGSGSGAESVVRQRIAALGIEVDQQVAIAGVGAVDMVVRSTRIVIEVDGYAFHSDPKSFENDRRRDAELVARGYTVVRLSFAKVFSDWAWCAAMILAAITQFRSP
jgi:very-short-patch-repair endonuclease